MSSEPLVKLRVGPQHTPITFLVDTGGKRSTVQSLPPGCKISSSTVQVIGARGEPFKIPVTEDVLIESEKKMGVGSLLLVPEADYNLLGRDLMVELGINVNIEKKNQTKKTPPKKQLKVKLRPLRVTDEEKINPEVWYNRHKASEI